jgi:predicted aminopeptidase
MRLLMAISVAVTFLVSGCATQVGYLARQGSHLLQDSTGSRDAATELADPSTPPDTRELLRRAREIKVFAVETVGLKDNGNYTRYKEIGRDHLVDVVQACDAVSFTAYLWSYPFLGKLPYKGFYERHDADAEAARLKSEGYDTIIRSVDAFSTLGFTKDPLYSFMKRYSAFQLASLIIHEQTHATLFVKGQPQFNEELASFVGDEGAFEWLAARYGKDSTEYRSAVAENDDQETFTSLLRDLSARLRVVYEGEGSREEKLKEKARIIDAFRTELSTEAPGKFKTEAYRKLGSIPLNNAVLSLYSLYSDDVPLLRSYWQKRCGGDLRAFVAAAVRLSAKGDVPALMRRELASSE